MSLRLCAARSRGRLTGVDQLLLGHFPALVALDLGLELADLEGVLDCDDAERRGGAAAYRFRGLGLDDELILLEILRNGQLHSDAAEVVAKYLECDLHGGG